MPLIAIPQAQGPRRAMRSIGARMLPCCAMVLLMACSRPEPPEKERPPEPQASHSGLRDTIQAPLDKAGSVEGDVQRAADEQRAAIEASGG